MDLGFLNVIVFYDLEFFNFLLGYWFNLVVVGGILLVVFLLMGELYCV